MTPCDDCGTIGRCLCCGVINYLSCDGYCFTCDAEIYHDLVLSQLADEESEKEAVASPERFD